MGHRGDQDTATMVWGVCREKCPWVSYPFSVISPSYTVKSTSQLYKLKKKIFNGLIKVRTKSCPQQTNTKNPRIPNVPPAPGPAREEPN